jgi:FixJ family two-component response regulator
MDGERTLDKIRQISPDLPIVLMTGGSELLAMERFAESGATEFLTKPFQHGQLQRAIERATRARSAGSAAAQ